MGFGFGTLDFRELRAQGCRFSNFGWATQHGLFSPLLRAFCQPRSGASGNSHVGGDMGSEPGDDSMSLGSGDRL